MHPTILIPTDFSLDSLNLVELALKDHSNQFVNVLLVHEVGMSNLVTDLFISSKSKMYKELATKDFEQACDLLRNHYVTQLNSLRVDLFTGLTLSSFNKYLKANNVFKVYIPKHDNYVVDGSLSAEVLSYINKSDEVIKQMVNWITLQNEDYVLFQLLKTKQTG